MKVIPLALSLLVLSAPAALADHRGKIAWESDFQKAATQAQMTGKPVMLYFTSPG
jgi:hypothetical protein